MGEGAGGAPGAVILICMSSITKLLRGSVRSTPYIPTAN